MGLFPRFQDRSQSPNIDPDGHREPGNIQASAFEAHTHQCSYGVSNGYGGFMLAHLNGLTDGDGEYIKTTGGITETRPINVCLVPYIKAVNN